ncbi:acetyltransferase [Enterococcus sp. JM4C]|nr:acetyltransferase [Enterococcus sp. JM4C]
MIQLKEITQENYKACVKITVDKEQEKFVAPNWYSLLEAKFEKDRKAFGLYNEEEMIGFIMFSYYLADEDYGKDSWWIERYMIASPYQNKGFGTKGLQQSLTWFTEHFPAEDLRISAVEGNQIAQDLYEKLGFVVTGEKVEDEIVLLKTAE